ncbi:glycosyltransferase family 39 protein [candidate division WWE3 bacterium]|nr:glycosyltransferase family 39 protein [candidate division WWE3 bacterium]
MRSEKRIEYALIGIFTALFLLTRLVGLKDDVVNPDAVNWHYRSEQFVVGLKTRQFEKTYQHYHPGVMLMWVVGPTVEILKQLSPVDSVYNRINFLTFDFVSKYVLVFVQLILSTTLIYLFSLLYGFRTSLFSVALFSFEPFFLGNSRLLHLDVLLTLFLTIGVVLSYIGAKEGRARWPAAAGVFFSLAFLTKSLALGGLVFGMVVGGFLSFRMHGLSVALRYAVLIFLSFVVTTFVFFPALWVEPVGVFASIFDEAERVGVRKGHGQVFFGDASRDPGILFYPVVLMLKMSAVTLVGLAAFVFSWLYERSFLLKKYGPTVFLTLFYLGYLAAMTYPSKKLDRYMILTFPYFGLAAVLGYYKIKKMLGGLAFTSIIVVASFYLVLSTVALHPYYFTFTNPLFGGAGKANSIIAQKPFGVGIPALKNLVLDSYGYYPTLGFYDTKPMKAIYPNSRIFDVRVYGPGEYDLLILGPNEAMPEKVLESGINFELGKTFPINGLDYWRIYVKKV